MRSHLIIILFILVSASVAGQCPQGDVLLDDQDDLENFLSSYSSCETIAGDLFLGTGITDLSGLTALKKIEGSLVIFENNIKEVANFSNLEYIGGDLIFDGSRELDELNGFNALKSIGGNLEIVNCHTLSSIDAFHGLLKIKGDLLISRSNVIYLSGFENLEIIYGNFEISYIPHGIEEFPNLKIIGGGFRISNTGINFLTGFNNLESVGSLLPSGGDFLISTNEELIEVSGFNTLKRIYGSLEISYNPNLPDIKGIRRLVELNGSLEITDNASLTTLEGLQSLLYAGDPAVSHGVSITGNHSLTDCSAICELLGSTGVIGAVEISDNPAMCSSEWEVKQECVIDPGIELLRAGTDNEIDICEEAGPVNLFDLLGDEADDGGVWNPGTIAGNGVFDPSVDASGVYVYEVDNGVNGKDSAEIEVKVIAKPEMGSPADLFMCMSDAPVNLKDLIGIAEDLEGEWYPGLEEEDYFNPLKDPEGVYNFVVDRGSCGSLSTEVSIKVTKAPDAGESATVEICINAGPVNLLEHLGGTPDTGGTWQPALPGGNGMLDPSSDKAGTYSYTVDNGQCGTLTAAVTVNFREYTPITNYEIKVNSFGENKNIAILIEEEGDFEYSLDGITFQNSNIFPNLSGGDYRVFVREIEGCGLLIKEVSVIFFPEFFTPNDDGSNDSWKLMGKSERIYTLNIFDRYGRLLRELGTDESWDGTLDGKALPSSDYWFRIIFTNGDIETGHFSLVR